MHDMAKPDPHKDLRETEPQDSQMGIQTHAKVDCRGLCWPSGYLDTPSLALGIAIPSSPGALLF